ncbi:hypothetical protein ACTJKO_16210 [Curtobacterium sp. 22159]|uniref:hypothetical protein n=1 Tax=Curtobacterium sp. 22159 TaxID=3453882 RepID=UPI003F840611
MSETTFAAYLIGPSIAIAGVVVVFFFGGVEGASAGAALILGGLLIVCTGMLVRGLSCLRRGGDHD